MRVVEAILREQGKTEVFDARDITMHRGDTIIVETDYGKDYAHVLVEPYDKEPDEKEEKIHKVLRRANYRDVEKIKKNLDESKNAYKKCLKRIESHKLPMKLVQAEYSLDRNKVVFYFTSEGRVDFRELVKELAAIFKARIELRQIGVRDESKMLGGLGLCGMVCCCKRYLKYFDTINIRMAKLQRLPLTPTKIFGICGRLLCCLKYEYKHYRELSKNIPKEGTIVLTNMGEGKIIDLNIIKQTVTVSLEEGRQFEFPVSEIKILEEKKKK
jgi:cell fate regulator YaaT (PSP1 superfamily)